MTNTKKRTITARLGKAIGQVEINDAMYDLMAPNGFVVQELEALGDAFKLSDAYRLVGMCVPTMPEDLLMQIAADDIGRVLHEIQEAMFGITQEALPASPKVEAATTA